MKSTTHNKPSVNAYTRREAAEVLDLTPQRIGQLVDAGVLDEVMTLGGRRRLITAASVEALRREREGQE